MPACVMFNEKNEAVRVCVADPGDWVEEGWRLEVIPEGHTWDGKAIVTLQEFYGMLAPNMVEPEVI